MNAHHLWFNVFVIKACQSIGSVDFIGTILNAKL